MEKNLLKHYRRDAEGNYLLEFNIKSVEDFYSEYDPFPYEQRDLNPKLVNAISKQMVVFPEDAKIKIVFYLDKRLKKKKIEDVFSKALRHNLEFYYLDNDVHLRRRLRKGKNILLAALTIFVGCVSCSLLIIKFLPDDMIWNILSEGFFVGGWVSMWHPVQTLLYDWIPLREEKKKFKRLMSAEIEYIYV
jgi:hypothetical protein